MKKEKVILLGGLVLIMIFGVFMVTQAALRVSNDLDLDQEGGPYRVRGLNDPELDNDAATWGYVKDAVNGLDPDQSNVGIWRQDETSNDVYLNNQMSLSGNVGIGTTDPEHILDLQGSGVQTLQIKSTSTTGTRGAIIQLGDSGGTYGELWKISSIGDTTGKGLSFSYQDGQLAADSDKKLWIEKDENDDVSINIGNTNEDDSWKILSQGSQTGTPLIFSYCPAGLCYQAPGTVRIKMEGSQARLGIGTANPEAALHVQSGDAWVTNNLLVGGFIGITECGNPGEEGIRIADDSYIWDDDCSTSGWPPETIPSSSTLNITSGDAIAIKSGGDGKTGTNYGIYVRTDGNVGIKGVGGSYALHVASAAGENPVYIGDNLNVGGSAYVGGNMNIDGDMNASGLTFAGGIGTESCTSGTLGAMRYYESSGVAYFQVCMNSSTGPAWYTIESHSTSGA